MNHKFPKGVIVAGGATSQLMGVAILSYFQRQGVRLELFYEPSHLAHTKDFVFKGNIDYQEFRSNGRLDKYFSNRLRFLLKPIRKIYRCLLYIVQPFHQSGGEKSIEFLSILIDEKEINVVKWDHETGLLYGEIWAGIIGEVVEELKEFFEGSTLENPFEATADLQENIAIHYRLGDMRTDRFWRKSHGVLDPTSICEQVVGIQNASNMQLPIFVYSDEPKIAKLLLESVGLVECQYLEPLNIWADIKRMSSSIHFIGSFSTVSAVVAEIRTFYGLPSNNLPLNCRNYRVTQELANSCYFEARILPLNHLIYKATSEIN